MNAMIVTYSLYLTLSLLVTVWVARTLHMNGRVFLVAAFKGNEALADSVNHLLVVGFYLVNLGFVSLYLKLDDNVETGQGVFEALAGKMGTVLMGLGLMHFFNLFVFSRLRRNAELDQAPPPVAPVSALAKVLAGAARPAAPPLED
ncbi:MAG: hypothetical protein JWL81_570 [Verrucomicrobiales bacterium]|nr:hypothetical protein [Verrucomicrobiales bacterium]